MLSWQLWIVVWNIYYWPVEGTESEDNDGADTDATEKYEDSSFEDLDDEPLSNLQKKSRSTQKKQEDQQQSRNRNIGKLPCGKPKGSASAKAYLYSDKSVLSCVHLHQCSVWSDGVDEDCAEKGIMYKRWVPNPDLEGHISICPFLDSSVVWDEQKVPGHCMLCP